MNKKLMAVAVAGALAAPAVAFAQASNVQIYGRANLGIDVYQAAGASNIPNAAGTVLTQGTTLDWKSRTRVYDSGSRFGLRGEENLGGGLKAIFLMENGVAMDNGSGNGQNNNANSSLGLAARLAYVGIAGPWGQITLGKQNVFWGNGQHEQWQTNYGSVGNQFFTGGGGRGMGVNVNRTANTAMYTTPVWNGVNAMVSYSPTSQEIAGANGSTNGRIGALTVQGTHSNNLIWGWDYVNNRNNTPAANALGVTAQQGVNTGNKLRGGWLYNPGANISLFWVRNTVENGGGTNSASGGTGAPAPAFGQITSNIGGLPSSFTGLGAFAADTSTRYSQQGWGIVWEHTWGNFAVEANWSKQSNISGCNQAVNCADTSNSTWFLGGRYALSKRTSLMAFYLKYTNAAQNNADPAAGGMTSVSSGPATATFTPGLSNGADPTIYGAGLIHNF